jgi:hypothetical protein
MVPLGTAETGIEQLPDFRGGEGSDGGAGGETAGDHEYFF